MSIKDSGNRREFDTGAVRDMAEGKGRCDLLPLDIVQGLIAPQKETSFFLEHVSEFIYGGNSESLQEAIYSFCLERNWEIYAAMLEASIHYEQGATKYAERNWEQGIPLHSFIDSAVRHYLKWRRGDEDEPHDRAVIWNLLGALWTYKHKPELADLPFSNVKVER